MNFTDPYEELAKVSYNGTKYDFRLEARWAVFMDAFGWDYERKTYWNQPSEFILHHVKIVITHKNSPTKTFEDRDVSILVSEEPNEYIKLKACVMQRCNKNIFMVGSIPNGKDEKEVLQNLRFLLTDQRHYGGYLEHERTYHFYPSADIKREMEDIESQFSLWVDDDGGPVMGIWHTHEKRGDGNVTKTLEAFKQARQARFEHGQDGYVGSETTADDDDDYWPYEGVTII